ncbi:MAG: TetM/TetW/TetO/TetS family tetracycline resistance ribosomal protection protein [Lachnospira sp.]|nr:TetM/TetW/TetO/TetS family tetracycline resistance ribosomal protection protein [Lachnospira sp.]
MKKLTIGMLAHVDAGKTTLSEAILFKTGVIRKLGRVDNGDAFLDTDEVEKNRGITIYSKEAKFNYKDLEVNLIDTPGHVDFSAEMERNLWALDIAVIVIDQADGVMGHTETVWNLLSKFKIPTFIFVNKMDQAGASKERVLKILQNRLSTNCIDFNKKDMEEISFASDESLDEYLEAGEVSKETIVSEIYKRHLFPVLFGSALKLEGVEELLDAINDYSKDAYSGKEELDFGARVVKITRENNDRLVHLKLTSGSLQAKDMIGEEKVNQIRVYNGDKFSPAKSVSAGDVCAIVGLNEVTAGQGLGIENVANTAVIAPVLEYKMILPKDKDPLVMLPLLRQLEEEEPALNIRWNEEFREIIVSLMGAVQLEILTGLIKKRFGVEVSFGTGSVVYKETIKGSSYGIGHFEPLRHYAEVHLKLEEGERGSGLVFKTECSEDLLDKNWQRLVLTHLQERNHKGVLIRANITDMVITLVNGRAHPKHTEGGDFRQATYRAIRQGLMMAESVILEPYYAYEIRLDRAYIGRAMTDIERMGGSSNLIDNGDECLIQGEAPVVAIGNYQAELNTYTKGTGRISLQMAGYKECHNSEEVIEAKAYDPERDTRNPVDSVFCAHGSGYTVPWFEVRDHAHCEIIEENGHTTGDLSLRPINAKAASRTVSDEWIGTEEVDRILSETYYSNSKSDAAKERKRKKNENNGARYVTAWGDSSKESLYSEKYVGKDSTLYGNKNKEGAKNYLLVDGYNIIHAWPELDELQKTNFDGARGRLLDIMQHYQSLIHSELIVVFDAYKVKGHQEEFVDLNNIHVVYTKEAETADHYIEKFAHENGRKRNVTVATSDGVEQVIIRGQGCILMSARELLEDVEKREEELRKNFLNKHF